MTRHRILPALVLLVCSLPLHEASGQSPNRFGWVYPAFPTGYGWVVPRVSPTATVGQTIGVTDVMVRYARPAVNGRTIWGDLVPYGEVWRAGANESTLISFSTEVSIEGEPLAAGEYSLFTIPGEDSWTVILSSNPHQWGHFQYNPAEDVLRVEVTPRTAPFRERLEYTIPTVDDTTAVLELHWERLKIPLRISVDSAGQAALLASRTFDFPAAFFAANYFLQQGTELQEALKWADVAVALNRRGALMLRAQVLGAMERFDEAIATAREARALMPESQYPMIDSLIRKWGGG